MNVIHLAALREAALYGARRPANRGLSSDPWADQPPVTGETLRRPISRDESGIRFEIGKMVQYAEHFMGDPVVIKTARTVTQLCPAKNKTCEMAALYQWTKNNFRYINDPDDREVISTPRVQIADIMTPPSVIRAILGDRLIDQMMHYGAKDEIVERLEGQIHAPGCFRASLTGPGGVHPRTSGDCDEGATFLSTMLLAAAIPARFRFGGSENSDSSPNWHHVWVQGQNEMGDWVDMDITEPDKKLGWFFPAFKAYGYVPIDPTKSHL
jgi:hypothetical protein